MTKGNAVPLRAVGEGGPVAREMIIALQVSDRGLARQIAEAVSGVARVKTGELAGEGPASPRDLPHVVVVQDEAGGDVFRTIAAVRRQAPQAEVFVVSADQRPEHIVEVMKVGAAEYLLAPLDREKLREALEKVRARLQSGGKTARRGALYSFISSKGGVGSTVLAVNTAAAMALNRGGSVALIDNSLFSGDSSVLLDVVPKTTIADVCHNFHRLDLSLLKGVMTAHPTGLDFLPAPTAPEESEVVHGEHFRRVLELARALYDRIVVDCASMAVDECAVEAFGVSDKIFVVTDLSVPAVRNASRLIQLIQKLRIGPQKIEVVVNRYIKGGMPPVSEIERTLGRRVSWLFPNDFKEVVASINQGVPLVKAQPRSALARNIAEFVERIKNPAANPEYRGVKGFLGRAV